jgi:hypothetical protein
VSSDGWNHQRVTDEAHRTAERVACNDATFREANDRIKDAVDEHGLAGASPFICECAEERCTTILSILPREYERIRKNPTWFVNAPGHDASAGPYARVVEEHDGFVVVEKVGRAAALVAELRGADLLGAERGGS